MRFPGEEAIAAFTANQPNVGFEAKHLDRVTLHLWASRRIVEIAVTSAAR